MADFVKSLDDVDLLSADGKTKHHSEVLMNPEPLVKGKMETAIGQETIMEPIMVKNATGKKCLYYFEEGSHHLLEVVEGHTDAFMPQRAQEIEVLFKRMWREILSFLRIFTSFFVIFIVEFIFYAMHYLLQPLVLNSVSVIGNQFMKPFFIAVFNNVVQPICTFIWNVLNAVVTSVNPVLELTAHLVKQAAMLLQSIRLVNVNYYSDRTHMKLETV